MAIDSIRLLTDSAAQLWRNLATNGPIDSLPAGASFEEWYAAAARKPLDQAAEQSLRRDYRRLLTLIEELETLVRSRSRALELVQIRLSEPDSPQPPPTRAANSA